MALASEKNVILARWAQVHAVRADDPAIWTVDGGVARRFGEIEQEAAEWSARFAELPAGSVVAIALSNHPAWPALVLAAFRGGLIPLPLPADVPAEKIAFCGVAARLDLEAGDIRMERLHSSAVQWPEPAPDFLKLTSGTTSQPRAVRFTSEQIAADCRNICRTMGLSLTDRNFGVIPFSHSYGFSNLIMPLLMEGIPLVAATDPFPRAILDGLERTRATVLPGVPALFAALTRLEGAGLAESVRLCISAGAPLAVETAQSFRERFNRTIHSFYGSSECGGICFDRAGLVRGGFVGEVMDGVELRVDPAVEVRSAAVALGYYPPDPALRDGAFYPADLLERDPEGWRLAGRTADLINVAGRKVNPVEIEDCLRALPGVRDCVVFGVEREATSLIYAVVVSEHSPETLRRHWTRHLPGWQVPRRIFPESEIPRTDRGKISRRQLAVDYSLK